MTINSRSAKLSSPNVKVQDVPNVPTIGTAAQDPIIDAVNVSFTPAATGGQAAIYRAVSNPGNIEGISYGSSPVRVTGLTDGTAYTFTVRGESAGGAVTAYTPSTSAITPSFTAYDLISSSIFSSNTGSIIFSSIPSGYKNLQIRMVGRNSETLNGLRGLFMNINNDYSTTCSTHYLFGNGSGISSGYQSDGRINAGGWSLIPTSVLTTGAYFSGIIDIYDYASTSKTKTVRLFGGAVTGSGSTVGLMSGLWPQTSAINQIEIYSNNSWLPGTRFSLYGIKG